MKKNQTKPNCRSMLEVERWVLDVLLSPSSLFHRPFSILVLLLLLLSPAILAAPTGAYAPLAARHTASKSESIPMDQLGAVAGKQYQGDGLSISATPEGVRLHCVFQRLEGQVTPEGLWLTSTAENATGERFRVVAVAVGRAANSEPSGPITQPSPSFPVSSVAADVSPLHSPGKEVRASSRRLPQFDWALARTGTVTVAEHLARFIRPGLTEEYSVSVDGVRQDFLITEPPVGEGDLRVELALSGARAEAAAYGAKLTLDGSDRALAYSRLRAVDAMGRELPAHLEVLSADRLAVRVDDANATYPVRIDPTFSDADWASLNPGIPGANGTVSALAVDDNGTLYVGGYFTFIGTVSANYIAKWDGNAWSALGSGMNYYVYALTVSGTDLYAGGEFYKAGGVPAYRIAKWDGTTWSALGGGMDQEVYALAVSGTNLYAGGWFSRATNAGGAFVTANCIAQWDGSAWSALGEGMNAGVSALAVSGTDLYAGGEFYKAGGVPANNIAKWDGSAWLALGSGMDSYVYALAVSGTDLYAGGYFTTAGEVTANYIAKWDGTTWSALGGGMDGKVLALAVSGTNLYAGGWFSTAANAGGAFVTANYIAKWDGSAWSALGSGMGGPRVPGVSVLAVSGTNPYAGGGFTTAGGVAANYIAKWNGSEWSALGSGMGGPYVPGVSALAVSGTNLYAGGGFTTAGEVTANYIAKWDGSAWSALGSGMDLRVSALAVSGTNLYAAGDFTTAGGVPASRIAKWDGSAWSALGSGMNDNVNALTVSGTNLYAGGWFSTAGGVTANNIAKWDGSAWLALGSGMDSYVYALAVSGTNLYAGGEFTRAGGVPAYRIAKWNGNAWSALGSGMRTGGDVACYVSALAVSGTNLYAGGYFWTAGGVLANFIAKWDGSVWSALGSGMDGEVNALAVNGANLYAGGYFWTAGGVSANFIAKWDGSAWSALGSGLNNSVSALAADGSGHLFVGGGFYTAGTKVSPFIAQANIGVGLAGGQFGSLAYSPVTGFSCTFRDATLGQPYRIQTSPALAAGSWSDFTNFTYTGPMTITYPYSTGTTSRFYRAVSP